jgi:hypothetical protein
MGLLRIWPVLYDEQQRRPSGGTRRGTLRDCYLDNRIGPQPMRRSEAGLRWAALVKAMIPR